MPFPETHFIITGPPKHRHAAPHGPWPDIEIDTEVNGERLADQEGDFQEVEEVCGHNPFTHLVRNDTGLGDDLDRDGKVGSAGPGSGGGGHHKRTGSADSERLSSKSRAMATSITSVSLDTMMSADAESNETVSCWCKYPQSLYPHWTKTQQKPSGILAACRNEPQSKADGTGVWILDMVKKEGGGHERTGSAGNDKGRERDRDGFRASSSLGVLTPTMLSASPDVVSATGNAPPNAYADLDEVQQALFVGKGRVMVVYEKTLDNAWEMFLTPRAENVKTRMFFVEKLTGPIMQMLGTHLKIEPFFFSSAIGKIPSRFQSNVVPGKSGHLTIILPFIRSVECSQREIEQEIRGYYDNNGPVIDTEKPLLLSESNNILVADMPSLHITRSPCTNTIISIQSPSAQKYAVSASTLHNRVSATDRSVYWNHNFQASSDPTFLFLPFFRYALYALDEAFEHLYSQICALEIKIMNITTSDHDITGMQPIHILRAHLLHYEKMLEYFRKTSAAGAAHEVEVKQWKVSRAMMRKECAKLLQVIERLEKSRNNLNRRLENVMNLWLSIRNVEDSMTMQQRTRVVLEGNSALKRISYLMYLFIPGLFVAAMFGLNTIEINPDQPQTHLWQYVATPTAIGVISTSWFVWSVRPLYKRANQLRWAVAQPEAVSV